jgi:chemosensory pili system protein ChpA (sensor histidine kinase/response regulator)
MKQDDTIEYNALGWVKKELDAVLNEARVALEAYIEDPGERDRLDECGMHIKQAQGTLQMVELFGAAMLAEEMSELLQAIVDDQVKNKDDAYEALIRAIIQLPDYLEHIQAGHKDVPIVLLPLMNDLRAARDVPLLSENVLFFPDLDVKEEPEATLVEQAMPEKPPAEIQKLARALRHSYQLALLGWFRDRDVDKSLKTMRAVLIRLLKLSRIEGARRLWWVSGAVADALLFEGLERGITTKQLLGRVDRQIKLLIDEGEEALVATMPPELIKNLLYYVATSESVSDQIKQVKKAYRLSALLPSGQDLEAAKGQVGGLNVDILQTVAQGIREDLTEIKDGLEIFVHTEHQDPAALEPLADKLRKVADTLTMLGLGQAREMVLKDEATIRAMSSGQEPVSDEALLGVAGVMLTVEAALNDFISNRAATPGAEAVAGAEEGQLPDAEYRDVLKAVIRETHVEMNKAKDAILEFISTPAQSEQLQELPGLLESVKGAMSMLPMERAVPILDAISGYISNKVLKDAVVPPSNELEALADAITSVEMYLESLDENRGDHIQIIEVGEESAARLHIPEVAESQEPAAVETEVLEIGEAADDAGLTLETVAFDLEDAETVELQRATEEAETVELGQPPSEDVLDLDFELPEAPEEEPSEPAPAADSEPVQAVEPEEEMFDLGAPIELVESQEEGNETLETQKLDISLLEEEQPPEGEEEEVMTVQVAMPDLADMEAVAPEAEKPAEPVAPAEAESLPNGDEFRDLQAVVGEMDDEIMEIFLEEAEEEIERINEYLPRWKNNQADEDALTTIRRSFHTLKGSGRLVGAQLLGEFAWAFEDLLNRVIDHTIRAEEHIFAILHESQDALTQMVEQIKSGTEPTTDICALMAKAHAMSKADYAKKYLGQIDEAESAEDLNAFIEEAEDEPPFEESVVLEEPEGEEFEVPTVVVDAPGVDEVTLSADADLIPLEETSEEVSEQPVAEDIVLSTETLTLPDEEISEQLETEEPEVPTVVAPVLGEQIGRIDPELLEIFSRETATHLQTLRGISEESRAGQSEIPVSHDFIRAMHTLNGSARTADVPEIFELCAPFERYAKATEELGQAMPSTVQPLLAAVVDHVQQVLESLADPLKEVPNAPELKAQIDTLLNEAEDAVKNQEQAAVEGRETETEVSQAAVAAAPLGEPDNVSDQDEELVEIFIDEAEEILDASDGTLQQWTDDSSDREAVNELQRQLHTLKGGARMAGFRNIGDLSHAVESLIIKVVEGGVQPNEGIFTTLRQTTDRLSEMVELARKQEPIYPAPELIDALDRLRTGQPLEQTESAPQAVEEAPAEVSAELPSEPEVAEPELSSESEMSAEQIIVEDLPVTEELVEPLPELTPVEEVLVPTEKEPEQKKKAQKVASQEVVRVRSDLLDNLVNFAGEVNIYHSRLEQQVNTFGFNLGEFDQTVARLREQLRRLEMETDAQILHNFEQEKEAGEAEELGEDFDPLEMDKYSGIQQLSRALAESVNDLVSIQELLVDQVRDTETLLLQQSRVSTDLQEGLMRTRMVQFSGIGPRLRRIVRQTATELGKKVELEIIGEHSDMDRSVLDHMIAPLEHMIRNSVAHGIETPEERLAKGKPDTGNITIAVRREGSEILIEANDDGAGIDLDKVRAKARKLGIITEQDDLADEDAMQLILESGFSTAGEVSQISGRGVGMDVVNNEIKQLGGVLQISSSRGKGTSFKINLPFTLAINQALLVQTGEDLYAVPLTSIEGIVRIGSGELATRYDEKNPVIEYAAYDYDLKHLNTLLGGSQPNLHDPDIKFPVLLVHSGGHRLALQVEGLLGSREVVVKSVGPQISKVRGISGATILGDGRVVLILDVPTLVRMSTGVKLVYSAAEAAEEIEAKEEVKQTTVMVVDDSITIRKVTSRMLERNNFHVITAKDGVDAVSILAEEVPDLMLLDIEMPRMDGYELATYIRNDSRLKEVPIIMITSRTGSKHRERAINIGVNKYLGKPYQESELLEEITGLLEEQTG